MQQKTLNFKIRDDIFFDPLPDDDICNNKKSMAILCRVYISAAIGGSPVGTACGRVDPAHASIGTTVVLPEFAV